MVNNVALCMLTRDKNGMYKTEERAYSVFMSLTQVEYSTKTRQQL